MAEKEGWHRTWPDKSETDGVLWRAGFQMGRVHQYWDQRWAWASWCAQCERGLADTKEEAKAEVERCADLSKMTISCVVAPDHITRNELFADAEKRYKSAAK